MTQTTIVTTPVSGDIAAVMLFSSACRWNGDVYLSSKETSDGVNGLWATAVWGTKGAWEPDAALGSLVEGTCIPFPGMDRARVN